MSLSSITVEKSITDPREYEYFKLKNGLQCLIIKDDSESQCGACLNVEVGSVNEKIEGLAHFLEHMVFMGSKKYPDSNDFMSNVNNSGGLTNAYTSDKNTNYHFIVDSGKYMDILDRFAQFFTNPLLKKEYVDKEINAVNSEAKKNLLDDMWIQLELYKTLLIKEHPVNHFTCGDTESLTIKNIYNELKEFHDKYYDAKYMSLVIFTNNDNKNNNIIDSIKKLVIETFGEINTNAEDINRNYGKLLKDNSIVYYVPNKDEHYLSVLIEGKTILKSLEKPHGFIMHILSNKMKQSLYDYLLDKGYIVSMNISDIINFHDYSIYAVECKMTDKGLENISDLYTHIIKYFNFILDKLINKDPELKKHFLELIQINKINYDYWEKDDINDTIIALSNVMAEDLQKEYLISSMIHLADYEKICENAKICFENVSFAISVGSKKYESKCKEIYPRYDVCYSVDTFKLDDIDITKFTLPVLNQYICYDLQFDPSIEKMSLPINLNSDKFNSFYYGDTSFKVPSVDIRTFIKMPNIIKDVETYVGMILYLNSAYGNIDHIKEMANNASYTIFLKLDYDTLYILLGGYTEKINLIVDILTNIFQNDFKERSFNTAKFDLLQNLKNFSKSSPLVQYNILMQKQIYKTYFTPEEQYEVAKIMTLEKCKDIFRKNFNDCRVSILTTGNIKKEEAEKINNNLYNNLGLQKQIDIILDDNMNRIDNTQTIIIKSPNRKQENSIGVIVFDLFKFRKNYTHKWKSMVLFARIYNTIIANKFFYELRTKKQMGYIVKAKIAPYNCNYYTNLYLEFIIQSPKYSVKKIIDEINDFLKVQNEYILDKMKISDYEIVREAEEGKLKRKFINLSDLGSYFMNSIMDESFKFDVKETLLKKIEKFNFDKFKSYLKLYIIDNKSIYNLGIQKS
jgi:secreted Zn-dependent insulinase-like peptidase